VFVVNAAVLALFTAYSSLNLRPDLARIVPWEAAWRWMVMPVALVVLVPAMASVVFVRPILTWARGRGDADGGRPDVPAGIAERAAGIPLTVARFSLLAWLLVAVFASMRALMGVHGISPGLVIHMIVRPVLAAFVAGTATFFAADYVCRTHVWPVTLAGARIAGNQRLRRVRVSHRLLALWLAVGVVPLGVVTLTMSLDVAGLDRAIHAPIARMAAVVLLISGSAALGGAWLAWLVAQSVGRPLRVLEAAMARLRDGHFETRAPVSATDEIGTLAEGFNLMAGRLAESYAVLEAKNRELTAAMDRILVLERMKRALDRFVPETARLAIEAHPEAPRLTKTARDVTVLFLDIEGYAGLSERLDRGTLNALVERYFSLFLTPIHAEGGDVNEIVGDGLMIIFQAGEPKDHAEAAVRAALAIREQTEIANGQARGAHPPIAVNIGVSSGECDVGATRFAGPAGERWTFTASGPVTNLAARLGDRADGGQIFLDAATTQRIRGRFPVRALGHVALKNLSEPVEVWTV
jgi:class 3 adenylate cyclase/HAMP domain-containing protein